MTISSFRLSPRVLFVLAMLFAGALILYSSAWMYYTRSARSAVIGIDYDLQPAEHAIIVKWTTPGGPAERYGLRAGDRIVLVNGRPLRDPYPFWDAVARGRPGDMVGLAVERRGEASTREISVRLEAPSSLRGLTTSPSISWTRWVAIQVLNSYPVLFLVVAVFILFQRYEDRTAWLLAVMFAGLICGAPLLEFEPIMHPRLRRFLVGYWALFNLSILFPAAFYYFFAVFPQSSVVDRRVPWLKNLLFVPAAVIGLLLAIVAWASPSRPFYLRGEELAGGRRINILVLTYVMLCLSLGLVSLVLNAFHPNRETRRRTRVIVWGTTAAMLPMTMLQFYAGVRQIDPYQLPFWIWSGCVMALFLLPVSFAYAVIKHRVMEIPVLLKRSARYLLVRRALVTVAILIGIVLSIGFANVFVRFIPASESALPTGPLSAFAGAIFGLVLSVGAGRVVRRGTERIDRAFFRSAYDARQLLQALASRCRMATDPYQLAVELERSLEQALHPASLYVLLRDEAGALEVAVGRRAATDSRPPAGAPELLELIRNGPVVVQPSDVLGPLSWLGALDPEVIVPMQGRDPLLEGLLVLGQRLSEEPYSGEDRELLTSVASQAGIALENIRLARTIAERLETEGRAAHEMEIAKEVQARLLPQRAPALETLAYAGDCIQARAVGGDYYDFLYLGPGQVGLVLADISGKGISAALLMASLQANLRSQYGQAPGDLPRVLSAVNQIFYEATASNHYATLFFAVYNDLTRWLKYVNCGHLPPLIVRRTGDVERLLPTAPAVGLFDTWSCKTGEVEIRPEDALVIFSDGATEALGPDDEEFGDDRLIRVVLENHHLPASALLRAIVTAVQVYSGSSQYDDLTLVVAKGRG